MAENEVSEHEWELTDASQLRDGDSVLELRWRCTRCGNDWGTLSGVTMPNEEAGFCDG